MFTLPPVFLLYSDKHLIAQRLSPQQLLSHSSGIYIIYMRDEFMFSSSSYSETDLVIPLCQLVQQSLVVLSVCSEARCSSLQRAGGRHGGHVDRAAVSGERGLPCSPVSLVPQQRGASSGSQNQPAAGQLVLQHQPRHRGPGEELEGETSSAS